MPWIRTKGFVVAALLCASAPSLAGADDHSGTYWIDITGDFPTIPGILAFSSDGRIIGVEGQGPETTSLGTWVDRGGRSVAGVFLWFLALEPVTGIDGGRYGLIGRVDFAGEFDQHRRSADLPFTLSVFFANQNPLVDEPILTATGVMTATRIEARR